MAKRHFAKSYMLHFAHPKLSQPSLPLFGKEVFEPSEVFKHMAEGLQALQRQIHHPFFVRENNVLLTAVQLAPIDLGFNLDPMLRQRLL